GSEPARTPRSSRLPSGRRRPRLLGQLHHPLLQPAALVDPADPGVVLVEHVGPAADHLLGVADAAARGGAGPALLGVPGDGLDALDGAEGGLGDGAAGELEADLGGRGGELGHGADGDELAAVEDGGVVADLLELLEVVAGDDQGAAPLAGLDEL